MRMRKKYCFVKITLSIDYWSEEIWFAYDVIGISNSKRDWNILVCPLARLSHGVVKINIRNCPISLGTKCFVYKRRVVSLFVPTLFSKIRSPPGRQSYIFCSPNTNFVRQGDRASANLYPCRLGDSILLTCLENIFPCRLCFLWAFPSISLIYSKHWLITKKDLLQFLRCIIGVAFRKLLVIRRKNETIKSLITFLFSHFFIHKNDIKLFNCCLFNEYKLIIVLFI